MRSLLLCLVLAACRDKPAAPTKKVTPVAAAGSGSAAAQHARPVPRLPMGNFTWSFAESSDSSAGWTAAADSYQRELDECTADCRELAYTVVLARNNAVRTAEHQAPEMDAPAEPMPPEVVATVAALDAYAAALDPTDDELAQIQFSAAAALWRWRDPGAIARLEAVLRDHRDDDTAEYAANQLLDMLTRENRVAELRGWVAELLADETFLANKPELRTTLEQLRTTLASLP